VKFVQVRAEEDKRATWLETRDMQENFKDLVHLSLQEVSYFFSICIFLRSLQIGSFMLSNDAVLCGDLVNLLY